VVVVAGQKDETPALESLPAAGREVPGLPQRVALRTEQELEHVTEEDHLVDVEVRLKQG
jgi:hypothetical protein